MRREKGYPGLDYFRIVAAFMIIAIHTSPLLSIDNTADFIFTRIIARIAVPFFFMVTGFFVFDTEGENIIARSDVFRKLVIKTLKIYGLAILLYLPVNIYTGYFSNKDVLSNVFKDTVFNGSLYHLWYLPASILGVAIIYVLSNKLGNKCVLIVTCILYVIGLFGDSYYGIAAGIPIIRSFYGILFSVFDFTRNGIFFTPLFLVLGSIIGKQHNESKKNKYILGFTISMVFLLLEGMLLHYSGLQRHDSIYLMLGVTMYFLFNILLLWRGSGNKNLRTISMIMYIIHPLVIILIRGMAKVLGLQALLIKNSVIHYVGVCILSLVAAIFVAHLLLKINRKNTITPSRAWIEINVDNLKHNVKVLREVLPEGCDFMAVVKANAYGHGDVEISKELNKAGVKDFAVATIQEAVCLRKNGVKGNILVLGYTHLEDLKYLSKYRLTQTVVDCKYARVLDKCQKNIDVHIKIDTGMNRLGENCENVENIGYIYQLRHLRVSGVYTHLCVSDSLNEQDVNFTLFQVDNFYKLIGKIKEMGYNPGKIHIQSSYGVLNFPELKCDYARIGIALYGVLSTQGDKTRVYPDLRPVLSVKARIIMIKTVRKGECISYGRQFIATDNMKIAIVSIGYADGIPRNISDGYVLLKGQKKPIIGKVCMDQMIIDITDISYVESGDIVTIIGQEGEERITAEAIAKKTGTITNELLSRLGSRLERRINICMYK